MHQKSSSSFTLSLREEVVLMAPDRDRDLEVVLCFLKLRVLELKELWELSPHSSPKPEPESSSSSDVAMWRLLIDLTLLLIFGFSICRKSSAVSFCLLLSLVCFLQDWLNSQISLRSYQTCYMDYWSLCPRQLSNFRSLFLMSAQYESILMDRFTTYGGTVEFSLNFYSVASTNLIRVVCLMSLYSFLNFSDTILLSFLIDFRNFAQQ